MIERTNDQWQEHLASPGVLRDQALLDLGARLRRGLSYALRSYAKVGPPDIEDFVQEALLKVLGALDTFRGESRFTTWAQKIAVHLAISELRRKRWQDISLIHTTSEGDEFDLSTVASVKAGFRPAEAPLPEVEALRQDVVRQLHQAIANDLTNRQRQAIMAAAIQGMPLAQVAEKMDTNLNALYKLLYDGRQNLKKSLVASGLDPVEILAAFEQSS